MIDNGDTELCHSACYNNKGCGAFGVYINKTGSFGPGDANGNTSTCYFFANNQFTINT